MSLLVLSRWIHILFGLAWVGEVITINFVIVPALRSVPKEQQPDFISAVFPRVFRLATILALVSIIAGSLKGYLLTDWSNIWEVLGSKWGIGIYGGAGLAFLLILFHLTLERKVKPLVVKADTDSVEGIIRLLQLIPRIGLAVILLITFLMFFGASA